MGVSDDRDHVAMDNRLASNSWSQWMNTSKLAVITTAPRDIGNLTARAHVAVGKTCAILVFNYLPIVARNA